MAKYIICESCKGVVEYNPEIKYSGGTSYTYFKCPNCGYEKKTNSNHIHYGNDGKK